MIDGMFDWFDPSAFDMGEFFPLDDIASGFDISQFEDYFPLDDIAKGWDIGDVGMDGFKVPDFGGGDVFKSLSKMFSQSDDGGKSPLSSLMSMIIPILASTYGTKQSNEATKEAQERMNAAADSAYAKTSEILNGAQAGLDPYRTAGTDALNRLATQPITKLAGNYGPVGTPSNMAAPRVPVGTPANIAAKFRPLGSGRALSSLGGR